MAVNDAWVILVWFNGKPVERGRARTWAHADKYRKVLEAEEASAISIDDVSQWEREQLRSQTS